MGALDEELDAAVVGAGVVGLAVARALSLLGREVVVLEAERAAGMHASSRNSEVIHAGFHYPAGSLKARLCVEGRRALYAYAAASGVEHLRIGKLVVATSDAEVAALESYRARGEQCGVEGLSLLDAHEVRSIEPALRCVRALFSAETGIIDSHGFMGALRRDAEHSGATVVLAAPVLGARVAERGILLDVGGAAPCTVRCRALINAAGAWAPAVARTIQGLPAGAIPQGHFAKGHYFTLASAAPFRHLVYPVAVDGGLGVHLTRDLAGRARFGPESSGCPASITPSTRAARRPSMRPSAATGPRCPTARSGRATRACGPSSRPQAPPRRTSSSRGPQTTACRAW